MTVTELTAAARATHDEQTHGRWVPTRAGILNVWRYHDEVFAFHRGRLLLRGPNGTGKSKALELLLPYLFDASLRPSRLSTFGGQERTMHWNLMGDGYPNTNRVGYVWLEFHVPGGAGPADGRWFTVGARLSASANSRKVTADYFTTDQRVGEDLALLGEGNRPLTRAMLEEAIGERGRVHPSAGEHRRAVLHTLFPGFDEDKYESLITALLQLRTPKLSEHLDPAELSVLLTRSLPPLDHTSIREIAEGFEKLDRRREDLAALERDVAAAQRLADRQRRYAQRVVRAAAARLISAVTRMDDVTRQARRSREELDEATGRQDELERADNRLGDERLEKGERAEALRRTEAYTTSVQLADLRTQAGQLDKLAATSRAAAERAARQLREDRAKLAAAGAEAQRLEGVARRAADAAERVAGRAGLAAAFEEAVAVPVDQARGVVAAATDARERQVTAVREALQAHERAVADRQRAETRLHRRRGEHDTARLAVDRRRDELAAAVDRHGADLAGWAAGCDELRLEPEAVRGLAADEPGLIALVAGAADAVNRELAGAEAALERRRGDLAAELEDTTAERDRVAAQRELAPEPPPTRTADRAARAGAPLWRLVTFADGTDPALQAGVEAALEDSGLLDAWVDRTGGVTVTGHDRTLRPDLEAPAPGGSLADVLTVEEAVTVHAEIVTGLLRGVAFGPSAPAHVAAVGADGSWRLAALEGSWSKPEAQFVGATARERHRQRRLAELARTIAELQAGIAALHAELDQVTARRARIDAEQRRRPPHEPVRAAEAAMRHAEAAEASRADAVAEAESELREAQEAVTSALRRLTGLASEHRLPVDRAALDDVDGTLRAFRRAGADWVDARGRADAAAERHGEWEQRVRRSREDAAEASTAADEAEADARALGVRVATLEAQAGTDVSRVLAEIGHLDARLREIDRERTQLGRRRRELAERIGTLSARADVDESARQAASDDRDAAADALRRLGVIGMADDARLGTDLAGLDRITATVDTARAIARDLRDVPYEPQQIRNAETRVAEAVYEVRQSLAGRADVSLEADDTGIVTLVAAVDGLRLGAAALHRRLAGELDDARAELTGYEEDLFNRTLSGSARRQVADRIRSAGALVDDMNTLLQRVRTASGMRVRLRWQVDPDLPAAMRDARELVLRDPESLSDADRSSLHDFFRARIDEVRSTDTTAGWEEQLLEVLDYRAWHRFVVQIDRGDGGWQPVTKRTHGQLSGGERAIALHLPLFAAAAAHYAGAPQAPRLILLDEVFVGVDASNRGQLLGLIGDLDLDAVMTSDHEWCTYTELDGIAIHQLLTDDDVPDAVTTARFVWDGFRVAAREPEELTFALHGVDDGR